MIKTAQNKRETTYWTAIKMVDIVELSCCIDMNLLYCRMTRREWMKTQCAFRSLRFTRLVQLALLAFLTTTNHNATASHTFCTIFSSSDALAYIFFCAAYYYFYLHDKIKFVFVFFFVRFTSPSSILHMSSNSQM